MLPPPVHDPDAVRQLADSILAEARYDRPPQSLPDRILEWFGEQIGKVLGSFVGSGAGGWLALVVVLGALAFAVYLVIRYGRLGRIPKPSSRRADVMVELTRRADEWRAQAGEHEAAGRWREGLRCRYRALVGALVEQGALPDQPGRTAGQHVRDVARNRPEVAPAMAAATELFEAAWYGGAVTGADEAARFADLDAQVLAGVPTASGSSS